MSYSSAVCGCWFPSHCMHCWWDLIRSKQLFSVPYVAWKSVLDFFSHGNSINILYIMECKYPNDEWSMHGYLIQSIPAEQKISFFFFFKNKKFTNGHPLTNGCPVYDFKQSDSEAPVNLEFWGIQITFSLPLFPFPLWPRLIAIFGSITTVWHLNCVQPNDLC